MDTLSQKVTGKKAPLIWLIAGEASGDLYGALLAENLRQLNPDVKIQGMGGVKMKKANVDLLVDSSELGVIGLIEVMGMIFRFIKIMKYLVTEAVKRRPDAVVMIDYPGFNIRFAKRLKKAGIPVIWYISPQVWAWRKSNIPRLASYCKKMLVIFPFEVEVYKGSGLDVEFSGHPLVEIVKGRKDPAITRDEKSFLILPGSRKSETKRLFHVMLQSAALLREKHPDLKFFIATPREKVYKDIQEKFAAFAGKNPTFPVEAFTITCGETSKHLQSCIAGFAASGTITVESAIAGLPLVVAYKLNPITFLLARLILRKLFRNAFTMPNIIMNRCVFEEFLQHQVTPEALVEAAEKILPGGSRRVAVEKDMEEMIKELSIGNMEAGKKTAEKILESCS